MKKFISFAAYALLASALTLPLASCGGDDDNDDNGGGQEQGGDQKFEKFSTTVGSEYFWMMPVEGGTFQMGAPNTDTEAPAIEKPLHSVTLSDFYIGEKEVTQDLWKAVMGSNPANNQSGPALFRPVEKVSWDDCQEFIKKLNSMTGKKFRMPTEAEWEYAARGGKKSKGYKYSGGNKLNDVAWYHNNSNRQTKSTGAKQKNELGLYDMTGNVREFCSDWFGDYTSFAQTNPTGPATGTYRVCRGGYYDNQESDRALLVTGRASIGQDWKSPDVGLRLAMDK